MTKPRATRLRHPLPPWGAGHPASASATQPQSVMLGVCHREGRVGAYHESRLPPETVLSDVVSSPAASGSPPPLGTAEPAASTPPTHAQIARARVLRRWLLLYDIVVLAGLLAVAILYFRTTAIGHLLPSQLRGLPAYTAWFGTLGSLAISMKGINDHGPEEPWGGRWPLWFLSRHSRASWSA